VERQERPESLPGTTHRKRTGCGNLYVTVTTLSDGTPFEVFAQLGKAGGCAAAAVEAVSRLVTDLCRCGVDLQVPIKTLNGISCIKSVPGGPESCFDAIARVLIEIRDSGKLPNKPTQHEPWHHGVGRQPDGIT